MENSLSNINDYTKSHNYLNEESFVNKHDSLNNLRKL